MELSDGDDECHRLRRAVNNDQVTGANEMFRRRTNEQIDDSIKSHTLRYIICKTFDRTSA